MLPEIKSAALSLGYEIKDLPPCDWEIETKERHDEVRGVDYVNFSGHAATWERDQGWDKFWPGAFKKSIRDRGPRWEDTPKGKRLVSDIKILWGHSQPLGIPEKFQEDSKGLLLNPGRIYLTALGQDALILMRGGVVDKQSIGYRPIQDKIDFEEIDGVKVDVNRPWTFRHGLGPNGKPLQRNIREAYLVEASPVTFPMNTGTSITDVKSGRTFILDLSSLKGDTAEKAIKALGDSGYMIGEAEIMSSDEKLYEFEAKADHDWQVGMPSGMPMGPMGSWDAGEAVARMKKACMMAGQMDWEKFKKGHLAYDAANKEKFGSYKFPVADMVGGTMKVMPGGVMAAGAALQGSRGGTTLPKEMVSKMKSALEPYYKKMDREPPWAKKEEEGQTEDFDQKAAELFEIVFKLWRFAVEEQKAGRRISTASAKLIRGAIEALQALLDKEGPEEPDKSATLQEPPSPQKPPTEEKTDPDSIQSALESFSLKTFRDWAKSELEGE